MFKNLKLSGKLWGLTLLLLAAVMLVAGISIWSISGILSANSEFSYAAELDTFMTEKEVDHLNWVNTVKDLFVKNLDTLQVTMDHTKCGLGKFLYGEEAHKLGQHRPDLVGHLDAIKEPHKHLHESAVYINEAWRQVHPGLSLTLAARLDDHRRWAESVRRGRGYRRTRAACTARSPGSCHEGTGSVSQDRDMRQARCRGR